ncbi:MAG: GTP-binding protein [Cytophagales bacterium]|nr:MAG: GTP-binding protein [Cytophagales bacterium]
MSSYLDMDLLRFTTAGSVDDGKSTLIGRLLYDTKSIFQDQLEAIEDASTRKGKEYVDLSLLTDGLRDERAQGITIDVAYRYFATPKRKFIISDTPGHIQYTRNMVTGASTSNLAIILIDARKGVIEQTFRHSIIASLLNIKHIVVAVNKMDLVNFDKETYEKIKSEYLKFSLQLNLKDIYFIPMSALLGDNVVDASQNMDWYKGKTLLSTLESVNVAHDLNEQDFRFPVQYVIRPHSTEFHDYRGYAGKIEGGKVKVGDTLQAMNSGLNSKIKSINFGKDEILEAQAGKCVSITLEDEIDISRGDMLVKTNSLPQSSQEIDIMLCWLNEKKIQTNAKYILRHTGKEVKCMVKNIEYKLNISTLEKEIDATIGVNDIGKVKVKTASPLFFDSYLSNRVTGSVILVDEFTNETVGAGMIV